MRGASEHEPDLVGRYEALRAHALGQMSVGWNPLGLAILHHRGVAAWMAAEQSALQSRERIEPERRCELDRQPVCGSQPELVRLLAGTALLTMKSGCS